MIAAFSGPHLWVLLGSLLYLAVVVFTLLWVIRMPRLTILAKGMWSVAIVAVPLGGLIVFWAMHWPRRRLGTATN